MSVTPPPEILPPSDLVAVMNAVRKAWYAGRPIVPIVGAGLSADSGLPVLTSVVRYFGKFKSYISSRAYLRPPPDGPDPLDDLASQYDEAPWRFVEDFGWPDRFQLNQDLLTHRGPSGRPGVPSTAVEEFVRAGLNDVLRHINPHGWDRYQRLRAAVVGGGVGATALGALDPDYALDPTGRLIDGMDLRPAGHHLLRPGDLEGEAIRRVLGAIRDRVAVRFDRYWADSVPFDLVGDWKKLIQYFTRSQGDHADALFATFGANREPALGHRYLAFLAKLLGCRTIFTFNFDSLIEQALEAEGVRPEVFAMEGGTGLPHHTLIRDAVAVIKLHGGNHSLLLDEKLDRPLGDEYMARFDRIVRENPLLLVVGCSGNDYRLRDLVLHVLKRSEANRRRAGRAAVAPDVVWLHYESNPPPFLGHYVASDPARAQARREAVYARGTNSPGATLLHLHSWLTRRCPAGRSAYLAHVQRPVPIWGRDPDQPFGNLGDRNFYLCSTLDEGAGRGPTASASQTVLRLARHWSRNGYQTIWVDLESVHTLAGVVGAIVDQCRQVDATLPPSVLPLDDLGPTAEHARHRAVELVVRSLRRTRYLVVLDGLETYPWPATTHHGLTHLYHHRAVPRLNNLCLFLEALVGKELGESRVCLAVDGSKSRHPNSLLTQELRLRERVDELQKIAGRVAPDAAPGGAVFTDCLDVPHAESAVPLVSLAAAGGSSLPGAVQNATAASLVLFYLSCLRRTRTLVAVDTLLRPVLGGRAAVDRVLAGLHDRHTSWLGMTLLEGGSYWFDRRVRNYLYENNTEYTGTGHMHRCLSPEATPADLRAATFQLLLTAIVHQQVARMYHSKVFVQSQDAFAFMEYTYHRLSSVRSVTKLVGLTKHVKTLSDEHHRSVVEGIRLCGKLFREASPTSPPTDGLDATQFEVDSPHGPPGSRPRVIRRLFEFKPTPEAPELTPHLLTEEGTWAAVLALTEAELERRHRRELQSLYRAWCRCEGVVRSQLPAEQLLNWCEVLLGDDLANRANSIVVGYTVVDGPDATGGTRYEPEPAIFADGGRVVNAAAEPVLSTIRAFFEDFRAKSYIERSDYSACIALRHRQLADDSAITFFDLPDPPTRDALFAVGAFSPSVENCHAVHCHYLLDIVACLIRRAQELTTTNPDLDRLLESPRRLLRDIERQLRHLEVAVGAGGRAESSSARPGAAHPAGDVHEARLRLLYLSAECDLLRASVFSHDGFDVLPSGLQHPPQSPHPSLPLTGQLANACCTVRAGLDHIRDQDPRTGGTPRSVAVDPTADGALYFQYRSLFHTLSGRLRWMGHDEGGREEAFEAAFRKFDLARGGLGEGNPLIAALAELYAVEACLARARYLLAAGGADPHDAPLEAAVAKFETARVALQRARYHLQRSRRNVIWWKLYFSLVAQYHADRLLLGYARLFDRLAANTRGERGARRRDDERFARDTVTQFLTRLRRGYQSVRSVLDLFLPGSPDQPAPRWPCRAWLQMTLAGYAVGRLGFHHHPESPFGPLTRARTPGLDARPCLVHYLRGLNNSALLLSDPSIGRLFARFEATVQGAEPDPLQPSVDQASALSRWAALLDLASNPPFAD